MNKRTLLAFVLLHSSFILCPAPIPVSPPPATTPFTRSFLLSTNATEAANKLPGVSAPWQWGKATSGSVVDVFVGSNLWFYGVMDLTNRPYHLPVRYRIGPDPVATVMDLRVHWLTKTNERVTFYNQVDGIANDPINKLFYVVSDGISVHTTNVCGNGTAPYNGWGVVTEEYSISWTNPCSLLQICRDDWTNGANQYLIGLQYRLR